jgi:hypothetical protein
LSTFHAYVLRDNTAMRALLRHHRGVSRIISAGLLEYSLAIVPLLASLAATRGSTFPPHGRC